MRDLLGGKGANLAEMSRLGLPVPPGFTITTDASVLYRESGRIPSAIQKEIKEGLECVEAKRDLCFGSAKRPLLVSVRSGAPISMPGMMDTILNLGLNRESVLGLARMTDDERFARDCFRRFIQMFGNVVRGIPVGAFERKMDRVRQSAGALGDDGLSIDDWDRIIEDFLALYEEEAGETFPEDPWDQLLAAVEAVFSSWDNPRAVVYRNMHDISHDMGTAVNVQSMVFGNRGDQCGTGVLFTRNPSTGERALYGEYLSNAQGEDVVAGLRTPKLISDLRDEMPHVYEELSRIANQLELHYRDVQDIEFTVEAGKLFLLQTRSGKRTVGAAVKVAHDMAEEGILTKEESLMRVDPEDLSILLHPSIDENLMDDPLGTGLPASPGAATGRVVFTADAAEQMTAAGRKVILVRPETTPDDIHGIAAAQGVLTSRGGMTCHAAIVARGMGKPCIVGCDQLRIDVTAKKADLGGQRIEEGDVLTLDGTTGHIYVGEVGLVEPILTEELETFLEWADEVRTLGVRANADTPDDATKSREFGAEGIGLCRTEHMFMQSERLAIVQEMILAADQASRERALEQLLPMQREDFTAIFRAMDGLPVTIRLLDPPLHEFLPDAEALREEIRNLKAEGGSRYDIALKEETLDKVMALEEVNPMLGLRGCRLGIAYPEIYEMQVRAILEGLETVKSEGIQVLPEIMVPLVSDHREYERIAELINGINTKSGDTGDYLVGTMIEVPRACLVADQIAARADFFSFGTNDLTQTVYGFSRDDAEAKFLHIYLSDRVLDENPFAVLDEEGVGQLIEMAIDKGRRARPELKIGICGEHGGEPRSIAFCHRVGMDYVSCSPYRVPVARLAAAQAHLSNQK